MISIENREAFNRAEEKARTLKPRVMTIKFGEYLVAGSKPGTGYTVCFRKVEGHWVASCTCPAHVADGRENYVPKPCYHIPSAYSVHAAEVYKRQQQREEEHPLPVCAHCGKPAFAYNEMWLCIDCIKERAAYAEEFQRQAEEEQARANAIETEAEQDSVREMNYTAEQEARDKADLFG